MGPSHRKDSHRSSAKAEGYLPWYCLSKEYRDAKQRRVTRRPNKKLKRVRDKKECHQVPQNSFLDGCGYQIIVVIACVSFLLVLQAMR